MGCRDLYAAVDRRAAEAARIQRQVTIMAAVRPTHQDEYETLQAELVRLFTLYQSRQVSANGQVMVMSCDRRDMMHSAIQLHRW